MIFIERNAVEVPEVLISEKVKLTKTKMTQAYEDGIESTSHSTRHNYSRHLRHTSVRNALRQLFNSKCAYCESLIARNGRERLEHFRPKSGVIDLRGHLHLKHYWWLMFEWSNLYLTCGQCSAAKGKKFPIEGEYSEIMSTAQQLVTERPLLLDPCLDDPAKFLVFNSTGEVAGNSRRGQITVELLHLNRPELMKSRKALFSRFKLAWENYQEAPSKVGQKEVLDFLSPKSEYAAVSRQFFIQWTSASPKDSDELKRGLLSMGITFPTEAPRVTSKVVKEVFSEFRKRREVAESYSLEDGVAPESFYVSDHTLERIEIKNLRAIRELTIEVSDSVNAMAPWTLMLGENGTGKSTVLQAVALAFAGSKYRRQLNIDPSDFVRRGCKSGYVRLYVRGFRNPIKLTFDIDDKNIFFRPGDTPKIPVLAYGATRLLPRSVSNLEIGQNYARVDNLFNPFVPLADATSWLLTLNAGDFSRVEQILVTVLHLPLGTAFVRDFSNNKVSIPDLSVKSLTQLSDGYQGILAIVVDILMVLSRYFEDLKVARGIVLIDELGAHLHPRWRMKIVDTFRTTFPAVQFLVSTHDPLCLRGINDGEVTVLKRDGEDKVFQVKNLPSISGMRVDQLLTSEHFGLFSTVDPKLEKDFQRYYALLREEKLSEVENAEFQELKSNLSESRVLGMTRRERVLLEAIDKELASSLGRSTSKLEGGSLTSADFNSIIDQAF